MRIGKEKSKKCKKNEESCLQNKPSRVKENEKKKNVKGKKTEKELGGKRRMKMEIEKEIKTRNVKKN